MAQINLNSISGITSITTRGGMNDVLTLHNNNTTEAVKLDGAGNTFAISGTTVDISIAGGGGGSGAGFSTSNSGLHTTSSIGVNTSALASTLTGVGNSFQGMYISNGMMIMDNTLNGDHYIGTTYNGLMAGPVNIEGTLSIDGNYVVV